MNRLPAILFSLTLASATLKCDPAPAWGRWTSWGDQGDGTYRNPVLPADYSDIDCIRVGANYYMISSTFQFSPGVIVLQSQDLVNWKIAGHVVSDLTQISPELGWTRMNRPARGIWAGAIRHHAGMFWVYFGTPDEGYFMSTAKNAAGPWSPLHKVMAGPGWDDCCPFWDDDGQGWFVGTHFAAGYKTWLYKMTPDGRKLIMETGRIMNEGARREANKLYKIGDYYYHLYNEWTADAGRYLMMQRSKSIEGPYDEKRQLSRPQRAAMEPNQGGLVQTEAGEWYFLTHHGTGAWEGRAASLLPVTWIDGWPVIGKPGPDKIGTMVWSGKKPSVAAGGSPPCTPQTNDDFSSDELAPQWEWNYQPRAEKWSLRERSGFMRLHAFPTLGREDNILKAGNTLTQRSVRTSKNCVTVRFDLSGLADGQHAGLAHFSYARKSATPAANSASLGVVQDAGVRNILFTLNGKATLGAAIGGRDLWVRSTWGLDGASTFSYSTDGVAFVEFGAQYQLAWGSYRGDRIGLFTYNNNKDAGFVDIDSFAYEYNTPSL